MGNTRDMRTLDEYIAHFEQYDVYVFFEPHLKGDEFGIIETRDGLQHFIPLLYNSKQVYGVALK